MASATSYFDANIPDVVLKSLFQKYDKDGSGHLGSSELRVLLETDLGMNKEEAESHALLIDKDGSGKTSLEELKNWLSHSKSIVQDHSKFYTLQKAVEYFRQYDTDRSGVLDDAEMNKLMQSLGCQSSSMDSAKKALDKDGNGNISFHEFLEWLNWLPAKDI